MKRTIMPAATVCFAALSSAVVASDDTPSIIVSATRTAQTADEALAAVTVIDREAIERIQPKTVAELLANQPGVQIAISGGYGKPTSVFLRGTESDHVLVLIDGNRVGSATLGSAPFQDIPVDQIERIEIVRGPRSSLYGSEAIGGVIQIFTRRGKTGLHSDVSAGYGSYGTGAMSAGLSGENKGTDYSLRVSRFVSEGIDARKNKNPDKDGYDNSSVGLNLGHHFGENGEWRLTASHTEGNNEYDGRLATADYSTDFLQQNLGASLRLMPLPLWDLTLRVGQTRDESQELMDGLTTGVFNTTRKQGSWQNDFFAGDDATITFGIDYLLDEVSGTTDYDDDSRDNKALFAQWQQSVSHHDWLLALRKDDNEAYGENTTGSAAWGYELGPNLRLTASYGTAFKAPTFNDLYYPGSGNSDLKPETSESTELSLRGKTAAGRWGLYVYRTDIENLIDWAPDATGTWHPQNVDRARIDGVEGELAAHFGQWDTSVGLSYTNPQNVESGNQLRRRAMHAARFEAGRRFGRLRADWVWLLQGHRYDDEANSNRLPAYGLLNMALRYDLGGRWAVRGKIENMFDQDYETAGDYNTLGRNVFVAVSYGND